MFVSINNFIFNNSQIEVIDCGHLQSRGEVVVYLSGGKVEQLYDQPAIDLVMRLCPQMLEGKRMKFLRHRWSFHNLVAHPTLQILSWLGHHKLGFYIHDKTIPGPIIK